MKKGDRQGATHSFDFSEGVRGKYAARYARGVNLVRLDPDIARAFPSSRAVNQALRTLVRARHSR